MMTLAMIDIVIDEDIAFEPPADMDKAVRVACESAGVDTEQIDLCVRFTSDQSIQSMNKQWRGKDKVTDVLSFPMQEPPCDTSESLGDIALAVPFILLEAARLKLPEADHIRHLIIHATLHLLGFDHIDDDDAQKMQNLEQQAMHNLGLYDPYPMDAEQL
ncbi:rRNA maturation RNase YbeY [Mariprofundus sp. EBB-1]|uniref:rRNA maturation RNase YbeY n=1 Tax=Mariprofundus sp. EBB-1 TaxID=2650971 RepID=UPI001F2C8CF1|nr:rRNA maturation RNase YbeY [Mariprofundus sp. EBB-1]